MKYQILLTNSYYIRKIFFFSHSCGILITTFGWLINHKVLLFHPPIILSWYLNKNQCLLTQLEYKLFNCTFLGNGPKFNVPKKWRYLLYVNTLLGLFDFLTYL